MRQPKKPQPSKPTNRRKVAGRQTKKRPPQKNASNGQTVFSMVMLTLSLTTVLMGFSLFRPLAQPISQPIQIDAPERDESVVNIPIAGPTVSASKVSNMSQTGYTVGVVAGHKGYDPGAVCNDGLTEAEVNHTVSVEVVDLLKRKGIQADLLNEFDDRLTEYQADALISIHADSCNIAGASGFKVARVTDSAIPEAEDRLVDCLNQEYGRYTGLPMHPASITDNMTNYHAFREINAQTPGVIIEMGFLLDDRYLLESKPKIVARGIAAGVLCFLEQ
ncbi:N-acetylmuramoyl-L-alanine amidase [Anaerolineales bacterium HSG6]|nr:N-acetylmuramoyl-L-alanine amidase [Anaerolineales bacterium HSG6]MDM8532972.1 N-acetylmuramoyl-L-alanine amidase [Anaerolineales bacterium HSG25]